jgi:hypothetical protein
LTGGLPGVGIDAAERSLFGQLPPHWIHHAARRWLTPGERRWCADQPCFREALVVVLCCKEAVWKAVAGRSSVWDLELRLAGRLDQGGTARWVGGGGAIEAQWRLSDTLVLALASEAGRSAGQP